MYLIFATFQLSPVVLSSDEEAEMCEQLLPGPSQRTPQRGPSPPQRGPSQRTPQRGPSPPQRGPSPPQRGPSPPSATLAPGAHTQVTGWLDHSTALNVKYRKALKQSQFGYAEEEV